MSSFAGLADSDDFEDSDVITVSGSKTISIRGKRYRKFVNTGQDSIMRYILSQKNCDKVYVRSDWYVEIKKHDCPMECIDQFGKKQYCSCTHKKSSHYKGSCVVYTGLYRYPCSTSKEKSSVFSLAHMLDNTLFFNPDQMVRVEIFDIMQEERDD